MSKTAKSIDAPQLTSYLLCIANVLMLGAIATTLAWDFGLIPAGLTSLGVWMPKAFLAIYWANILLLMFWFYRTTRYLEDVSHTEFENGPFMAAFSLIIPILSLWKPYQSMLEIYKASRNPNDWKDAKQATIVGVWWTVWLIASVAGIITRLANSNGDAPREVQIYFVEGLRLIMTVQSVLLLLIVGQIIRWLQAPAKISGIEQVF